jgi:hypothetical protein
MRPLFLRTDNQHLRSQILRPALLFVFALITAAGCRKTVRTEDPQLKPVQQLLDAQLPVGTSEEKVKVFLCQQGYMVLPSQKPGIVVALISTSQNREASSAIARVTFYFDANGKLNTFTVSRASGESGRQ